MAVIERFPQTTPADAVPGDRQAQVIRRVLNPPREPAIPEYVITPAGRFPEDGHDISRVCLTHRWMSLPVPFKSGVEPPRCELCEASRQFIDGFSRYQDFLAKRQAGLV